MGKYGKGDTKWFQHDRFGMFIHWGLYSMPARHEWFKSRSFVRDEDYQIYFDLFNPDLFAPKAWAKSAKAAGMKYFVITTKHHEGFCLWDSQYTDYKITNTPFGRDALREIVDAFRAEGLRVGLYYSLIDWHHPDFTIDQNHPLRDLPAKERDKLNAAKDMHRYAQYMRDQVTELLTQYGKIDILWFDFSYPKPEGADPADDWKWKGKDDWESEELVKLIRSLQPGIILDNRLNLPDEADLTTPEQYLPSQPMVDADGKPLVWEGCHTFSGSWGYHRDETTWKTPKQCIDLLVNLVSAGGNLLMNVGPTSRGYLDYRAEERLAAYAEWMKFNSRSIYGCGPAPAEFVPPQDCRYTYDPETKRLYLHLLVWPFKSIHLPGLAGKVKYAQLLQDGSEILRREGALHLAATTPEGCLTLDLPVPPPPGINPVIELFLK